MKSVRPPATNIFFSVRLATGGKCFLSRTGLIVFCITSTFYTSVIFISFPTILSVVRGLLGSDKECE